VPANVVHLVHAAPAPLASRLHARLLPPRSPPAA
jgi:hypothetical protein